MEINDYIVIDVSEVDDLRHIAPSDDSGMRMLSYTVGDFNVMMVELIAVVVLAAIAVPLLYAAVRPRRGAAHRRGRVGGGQALGGCRPVHREPARAGVAGGAGPGRGPAPVPA